MRLYYSGSYTKSDLKAHPGFNPDHLRWGQHGQCHATREHITARGNKIKVIGPFDASRWLAHRGDKERARHAGRPDGLMHTPTPGLRSNDFKRALAAQPAKPVRKPRAKKAVAA